MTSALRMCSRLYQPATASLQKSLQNLQDASDDLMMLEEDAMLIPYQIGDVFVSHTQEETQEMLEAAKVIFLIIMQNKKNEYTWTLFLIALGIWQVNFSTFVPIKIERNLFKVVLLLLLSVRWAGTLLK